MTTPTRLDYEAYKKDLASLQELREEIQRLEGFDELTASQERKLTALRSTETVLDEQRKQYERACLEAGVSFDGRRSLTYESGHTPVRELDDDPFG